MSLVRDAIYDGSLMRTVMPGDVVSAAEGIQTLGTSTALTVTGAMLAAGIISGAPSGAATYTLDTAANILAALSPGVGQTAIANGTTFRLRHINTTANAVTWAVTANTGMSIATGTTNASSVKDFLVTIVNGTPPVQASGTTVNGSAVVSNVPLANLQAMSVGQVITNAVAGLQGATVISINIAAGTFTASANANATNSTSVAISLSPVISVQGIGQGLL